MLTVSPCLKRCDWLATDTSYDGEPLLACGGCGSEWVPSQAWSPRQADGSVPAAVVAVQEAQETLQQTGQRGERGRG